MYAYVWVKDEGKGDRAGLSEAAEIRKTYDSFKVGVEKFLETHVDV